MDYLFMETNFFVVDSYNPNENITEVGYEFDLLREVKAIEG